ncbi:hypothetical protein, partial [Acinetobacter haemolyticus]|uniref:hypothetical protein n=1 Tax=Acinetobacter haemolyticus TaxID=29430 RepID=UPI003AF66380
NWLCGRFCVQASSFENYIAEKPFTDRFVQQSQVYITYFCFNWFSKVVNFIIGKYFIKSIMR